MGGVVLGTGFACPVQAAQHFLPDEHPTPVLRLSSDLSLDRARQARTTHGEIATHGAPGPAIGDNGPDPFALPWRGALALAQAAGADVGASADDSDATSATRPNVVVEVSEPPPEAVPTAPGSVPGNVPDDGDSSKRYGLAPIRWGGEIGYSWRRQKPEGSDALTTKAYEISAQASSYILQPWIAQVNGRISLALITTESDSSEIDATRGSESLGVSGSLGANIFPLSRFPLALRFAVSDSRSESTLITSTQRSYRFSARQDYRPVRGRWSAYGTYDWDRIEGGSFGDDTLHRVGGGYRWQSDKQSLDVQGSLTENDRSDQFSSQILVVTGNHHYQANRDVTVSSTATLLQDKRGNSSADNTLRTFQAYSAANWVPIESPWSASASARFSRSESNGSNARDSFNINGTGRYRFNRNLSVSGSMSISTVRSGGRVQNIYAQNATLSYTGDPLRLGNYSYNWGTGIGFSNTISDERDSRTASTSASHSLNRQWLPGPRSAISASVGQAVSYNRTFGLSDVSHTTSLSHNGSLSYHTNPTDSSSGSLGISVSDTRTRGDRESEFQMLNVQLNGFWNLSRHSQLNANLSYQKSWRNEQDPVAEDPFDPFTTDERSSEDSSLNGSINYFHDRPFSVRGLRYSLRYTASESNGNEREFGVLDAEREETTQDLEQNLDYRIGRLNARLQLRIAEVDGRKNAVLFFRVTRSFGGY